MQELFAELFWENTEITEKAARLCESLPGFDAAQQEYEETAAKVRELVGYQLFDRLQQQSLRCTGYEVRAYYALGLGLREQVVRWLEL